MKRVMFALLSMALAGASFAPKASAATTTTKTPLVEAAYSCFNGQIITLSGVVHETVTVQATPSGNLNLVDNLNYSDVKGTDMSTPANSYVAHQTENYGIHIVTRDGATVTFPVSIGMVSTGSAPNLRLHALFHITVTPDGTTTSSFSDFTTTCGP
jgi:hypothetical protein